VADIVLHDHERVDGSGYPDRLLGKDISIAARIVAVADVFDAMVSHRPYRPALGVSAALAEIRCGSGIRYDADVAAAPLRIIPIDGCPLRSDANGPQRDERAVLLDELAALRDETAELRARLAATRDADGAGREDDEQATRDAAEQRDHDADRDGDKHLTRQRNLSNSAC
jgi:hypothetical protein